MKPVATLLLMLALLPAACRSNAPKGKDADRRPKGEFTISEETTYVTKPLDKDGYPDYVDALNERLGKGVTPANNANVLIWKALGPHPGGATMPAEFFEWLGVPPPPEKGDFFLPLDRFIKDRLKLDPGKATDAVYDQQMRAHKWPWKEADCPAMASWLKVNEKSLGVAIEATRRSHYFSPMLPQRTEERSQSLMSARLPAVQGCRELMSCLVARAMLRLGKGDSEGAWQDLLSCHRLGRLVGRGGTLMEGLVGIAIDTVASHAELVWLDRARPDAKRIQQCLADLRALPPLSSLADKADLTERFVLLEAVFLVDRYGIHAFEGLSGGPPEKPSLLADLALSNVQWDPALRSVNRWYDRTVAALRLEGPADCARELDQIVVDVRATKAKVTDPANLSDLFPGGKVTPEARGKVIGDILISLLMPDVRKVRQADDRARQVMDNVTIAFALAWYRCDHGRYPEKLESLAPKYLPKVPKDRFSGEPLLYRPAAKGYLLYSVGVDGEDEGGRSFGDMPPGDDLPVRMPLPEPRK